MNESFACFRRVFYILFIQKWGEKLSKVRIYIDRLVLWTELHIFIEKYSFCHLFPSSYTRFFVTFQGNFWCFDVLTNNKFNRFLWPKPYVLIWVCSFFSFFFNFKISLKYTGLYSIATLYLQNQWNYFIKNEWKTSLVWS